MYWCNPTQTKGLNFSNPFFGKGLIFLLLIFFTTLLPSCKPDNVREGATPKYFDLKGYFKAGTARLKKRNPLITKTVTHNGVSETKKVHINEWGLELNLFSQSDINKPAWHDSYNVDSSAVSIIYRAKTPDLKTQLIIVNKSIDKVKWILVINRTKNRLYETSEQLSYFPDSLYIINKYQKVRLLGANRYVIKGTLN
jgi:hypothetical protein